MPSAAIASLTPREREVLEHIAAGDSLAEIAERLHRSLKTIESHRLSIGRKLKASNRVELARIAIAAGLVTVAPDTDGLPRGPQPSTTSALLEQVNQAVGNAWGRALLQRFCQVASTLPGVEIAGICIADPLQTGDKKSYGRIITSLCQAGQVLEPTRYAAENSPPQVAIEEGECVITEGVLEHFPDNPWLLAVKAESCYSLALKTIEGENAGVLGLVGLEPMRNVAEIREVVEFFAPRLAGAVQACIAMDTLSAQQDQLASRRIPQPVVAASDGEPGRATHNLATIVTRVHGLAGTQFLRGVVDVICETYGLYAVGLCALEEAYAAQKLRSVIFRLNAGQADPICYDAEGTPCEVVLKSGLLCTQDHAAQAFPGDPFLVEHQVNGFIGVRLPGAQDEIVGVLWCVDKEALTEPEDIENTLRYFAPRIGAELFNFLQYETLLQEREQLEKQLEQAQRSGNKPSA